MEFITRIPFALVATLVIVGCGKSETEQAPSVPSAATAAAPPAATNAHRLPPLPRKPPIPASMEMAVYTVDSVMLAHPTDAPSALIIKVLGTVRTGGWSNLKLVEAASNRPDVKSYKFVGTSPPANGSTLGMQRAQTELRLDSVPAGVTTIRIISESNEVSAAIPH